MQRLRSLLRYTPLFEVVMYFLCIVLLVAMLTPSLSEVQTTQSGIVKTHRSLPIALPPHRDPLSVTFNVRILPMQTRNFVIIADDCIDLLTINGISIPMKTCPSRIRPMELRAEKYLHTGDNRIQVVVRDTGWVAMGLDFFPVLSGVLHWIVALAWLGLLCIVASSILRRWITRDWIILTLVLMGIFIRWYYALHTPYDVRAYDFAGHLDYVRFLAEHWTLPPGSGWEYHQAPFYYGLSGLILRGGHVLGFATGTLIPGLQQFSVLLSSGILLVGVWIGTMLFRQNGRMALAVFTAILMAFPGLVMLSSRISNDVLTAFLVTLGAGTLLLWWETRKTLHWYIAWLVAALAFLTKLNGIVLVPSLFTCLLLMDASPLRKKLALASGGLALFIGLTVWLPLARFHQSPADLNNFLMTGKASMSDGLRIRHSVSDFFIFNPIAMVEKPFVSPWVESTRRKNYFEYLFRSSFFGEFDNFSLRGLAKVLICFALALLPFMFWSAGTFSLRKERSALPVMIVGGYVLLAALAYAIHFSLAPEQDFRFSSFLAIVAAYFIARNRGAGRTWPQNLRLFFVIGFAVTSGGFLLAQ